MKAAQRRRILFLVNRPEFFLSHRLPVAIAARDHGYDVHVATPSNEHTPRLLGTGLPWHEIHLSPGSRNPFVEARTLASIVRCYRTLRPDLVHQLTIKPVLYGTIAARLTGVPAVVNAMPGLGYTFGDRAGAVGRIVRATFRFAVRHPCMRFIFQNADDRDMFVTHGWSTAGQAILIRGSGVDPQEFRPADGHDAGALPVVMFAGRLLWTKGISEFIDVARMLRGRARFVVVGDVDKHRPDSVTRADLERWRDEAAVEIWGGRDDMPAVLRQAAIFCLPSYMPEGVPKALLEAAATQLPIVTTDTPGCRDVVSDGGNGFLVPPHDARAIAAAIERLLADASLRERFGRAGRQRVVDEFTVQRVVADTLRVYDDLLRAGRS